MTTNNANSRGLTWIEVVVILGCCIVVLFLVWKASIAKFFMPNLASAREKARRVNCLANLNGLHKGLASWGLDPSDPWRPPFPLTNMHSALQNMGIAPTMFICPIAASTVNRSLGISPAADTAQITASNCNYNYWTLRTESDGDQVLICDRNGAGNASNGPGMWGGNHEGAGGNYVTVAGAGKWVGMEDVSNMSRSAFDVSKSNYVVNVLSKRPYGLGVVTNN